MREPVVTRNGCPLCGNYLKGNNIVRYLCKTCGLLFTESDLSTIKKRKMFKYSGK